MKFYKFYKECITLYQELVDRFTEMKEVSFRRLGKSWIYKEKNLKIHLYKYLISKQDSFFQKRNCSVFLIPSAGVLHATGGLRLMDFKFTKYLVLIRRNVLLVENGFEWTPVWTADWIPKDYINKIAYLSQNWRREIGVILVKRRHHNTQIHFLSKVIPHFKQFKYLAY